MTTPTVPIAIDPQRAVRLLAEATAAGLVSRDEVSSGAVNLRILETSSGTVHALLVRGRPVAYVKTADPLRRRAGAPGHEQRVLTALAPRQLGPRLVAGSGPTLWFAALSGTDLAQQPGNVVDLAETCQTWGTALASLHTSPLPAAGGPLAPRPWWPTDAAQQSAAPTRAQTTVLRALTADRHLRQLAADLADRWQPQTWVHGDQSAGHVVVDRARDRQVRFVDFAGSGIGDPSWDVASALETIALLAPSWQVSTEVLQDYFLRGYRRAGGPGRVDAGYRALRAGLTAWRVAAADDGSSDSVAVLRQSVSWLARARQHAGQAVANAATWR